jgi:hypothetical protein
VPRRLIVLSLSLFAVLAPAASARVLHASRGHVAARLSYTVKHVIRIHDARLRVVRDGATAFDAPLAIAGCEPAFCRPVQVRVVDLDGDGEPEVLADAFSQGAHCCTFTEFLRWDGSAYQATTHGWGDPGYRLRDLGGDGRRELITADDRFAYAFAAYAFGGEPVQILRYRAGALTDVTPHFRGRIRSDARRWRKAYRGAPRGEALGVLAAWVADQWQLGRRHQAHAFLEAQRRAGKLVADKPWPSGRHFIRVLERRLERWGY